jgi:hypothetical protein
MVSSRKPRDRGKHSCEHHEKAKSSLSIGSPSPRRQIFFSATGPRTMVRVNTKFYIHPFVTDELSNPSIHLK